MSRSKMGTKLGRSFTRASGRVANRVKHSPLNGRGPATMVAAAAGALGVYAAMRFLRHGPESGSSFDVQQNEEGGWTVRASETFGTRGEALEVARRATEALRSKDVAGNPLETPENSIRRPWTGAGGPQSSMGSSR